MSYAVWYSVFQPKPHDQFILPYSAQSPITKDIRDFNTIDDIWNEVGNVANADESKRSIGQNLWYLIPLFANPVYLLSDYYTNLINEYFYITEYNIPLAKNLDDADALKLEYFTIIKNEIQSAIRHKEIKDGSRRKN